MRLAMGQVVRLAALVLSVAVSAAAMFACNDDGSPEPLDKAAVTEAVRGAQAAFSTGDARALCNHLSRAAARQAGAMAHGKPSSCGRDVRRALGIIDKAGGFRHEPPPVESVEGEGKTAVAKVALPSGWTAEVPLTKERSRWRIDSFFGTTPAALEPGAQRVSRAGGPVEALDALVAGRPRCPEFFPEGWPSSSDGCQLLLNSRTARIDIRVLTAFGDFHFATCWMRTRMTVDANGDTWTHAVEIEGAPDDGCGDVEQCDGGPYPGPWKGHVYALGGGRFVHRADVCLDTCVGHFQGELTSQLSQPGRTVTGMRFENAPVGDSGFQFDGDFASEKPTVELRGR